MYFRSLFCNLIFLWLKLDLERDFAMRIDKYLKVSRLIKRRTLANEACEQGKVKINGKVVKPGAEVKIGDVVEIQLGNNSTVVEVVSISEHVSKEDSKEMYKIK